MELELWEKAHAEAFSNIRDLLPKIRGMFVAYNSNIDAIKHITEEDIANLLKLVDLNEIQEKVSSYPREIKTPVDFLARLIIAMRDGKAAEVPTYTSDIHEWLMDNLVFDKARMGGQAGIISNHLAHLGIRKVITYVPWLSMEQAEYFAKSKNLMHPIIKDGVLLLKHPTEAYDPKFKPRVNWIIEFSKGMKFKYGYEQFEVPRDNRLIISSRPPWIRIDMNKKLYEQLPKLQEDVDGAILAGYQMIREEYEDGTTYHDYIEKAVNVIKRLREGNSEICIHLEFTSISNRVIRKAILNDIVCHHVQSLGLDTVEVANALNVMGFEELAYSVIEKDEKAIVALYEGAVRLLHELKLERVHVHSLGFYICVVSKNHPLNMEGHKKALLFASTLAATQALLGDIKNIDDVAKGLEVPISRKGYEGLEILGKYLVRRDVCSMDDFEDGCISTPTHNLIIIPTKIVDDPVATVGIGDAISAGAFVAILAEMKI